LLLRWATLASDVSICRKIVPEGLASPGRIRTAFTVPSQGDSNSKIDLSLSSSPTFWPLDTRAPGWILSVTTVSSFTVAPIEGMGTSIRKVSIRV
jgi:hypothetical protein